ncbi:MAG: hypothetical protein AB9919_03895 [Geobacteraceae bacterium]
MEYLLPVAGFILGGVVVWLLLKSRTELAFSRGRAELQTEVAALVERLQGREEQLTGLRASLTTAGDEIAALRVSLKTESEKRSAAEEKNTRIVELETALRSREEKISGMYGENAAQKAKISELATLVQEERKASEEKLAVLDAAQVKLSDAFKALSAEALQSNNRSFLELARTQLEKFQEVARGDLEHRQLAIDELVKPLRESLEKVDGKIHDLEKIRTTAYVSLTEQIKSLASSQSQLQRARPQPG